MAYVRFSQASDVYLYYGVDGEYVCYAIKGGYFTLRTKNIHEVIAFLKKAILDGNKVPQHVIPQLEDEAMWTD